MVGVKSAQGFFEHSKRQVFPASVGADLCHQENFLPPAAKRRAHPVLGFAAMILPAVVEEVDATVDCGMRIPGRRFQIVKIPQVMAAKSERGNFYSSVAERPEGDAVGLSCLSHNSVRVQSPALSQLCTFSARGWRSLGGG